MSRLMLIPSLILSYFLSSVDSKDRMSEDVISCTNFPATLYIAVYHLSSISVLGSMDDKPSNVIRSRSLMLCRLVFSTSQLPTTFATELITERFSALMDRILAEIVCY
jgi:hypothetical protein